MKSTPIKNGFTLVEAMLAVIIAGTALVVLFAAATKAIAIGKKAREYEIARTILNQVEMEEPIQYDDIKEEQKNGTFSDHPEFRWERSIEEYGKEEDEMFLIKTKVSWSSMHGELSEETVEILHVPSAEKGGWVDDMAGEARD